MQHTLAIQHCTVQSATHNSADAAAAAATAADDDEYDDDLKSVLIAHISVTGQYAI